MNMDLNALKESLTAMATALAMLKQLKDSLPKGSKRAEATIAIEQAERQLKLAGVQAMRGLGYEICRNHKMPEIMLSKDDCNWECPKCKNKKYTGSTIGSNPLYG